MWGARIEFEKDFPLSTAPLPLSLGRGRFPQYSGARFFAAFSQSDVEIKPEHGYVDCGSGTADRGSANRQASVPWSVNGEETVIEKRALRSPASISGTVLGVVCALLLVLSNTAPLGAQDAPGADRSQDTSQNAPQDTAPPPANDPGDAPPPDSPPAVVTGTNELLGAPLFPFYHHYRRPDQTEVRNILYPLFYASRHPSGDRRTLFLPFFYRRSSEQPPRSTLHIYPLGYLHKRSEESSYDHFVPLYFDYESDDYEFQGVPPLWVTTWSSENDTTSHHALSSLAAYRHEKRGPHAPATSFRFGLWRFFGLTESYTSKPEARTSVLNPLSLAELASPFSLYHYGRQGEHEETQETCLLYTSPSPRDGLLSRMPSSA